MAEKKPIIRADVELGLNYEPLRISPGDGLVWAFERDVSPAQMSSLIGMAQKIGPLANKTEEEMNRLDFDFELLGEVSGAIGALLTTEEQRTEWEERGYGIRTMIAMMPHLIEAVSGKSPTTSPSASGSASGKTGSPASRPGTSKGSAGES